MKVADGTKIAERALEVPCEMCRGTGEILSTDHGDVPCPDCISREHQKRFSAAEERERVLRDALEEIRELAMTFALVGNESQRALSESVIGILRRAALATPAPQQPAEKGPVSE